MVKFYESTSSHSYPFPTVTLAYYLRYPNPYSTHVISTDILARHFDPDTQRLFTARLHLKRSRVPAPILALLPKSFFPNRNEDGSTNAYILERSVVDVKEGVMWTESRNLEFTGVLVAREKQFYSRPSVDLKDYVRQYRPVQGIDLQPHTVTSKVMRGIAWVQTEHDGSLGSDMDAEVTPVSTIVELQSRVGEMKGRLFARAGARKAGDDAQASEEIEPQEPERKVGFFQSWTTGSIQRSIEAFGLRRTERAVPKSREGMNVVLERLRNGGLVAVLEGMRRDREIVGDIQ